MPGTARHSLLCFLSLQLALLPQRLDLLGQAPEVDEALGVGLVVVALLEGDQVFGVEALRGGDAGVDDVA